MLSPMTALKHRVTEIIQLEILSCNLSSVMEPAPENAQMELSGDVNVHRVVRERLAHAKSAKQFPTF